MQIDKIPIDSLLGQNDEYVLLIRSSALNPKDRVKRVLASELGGGTPNGFLFEERIDGRNLQIGGVIDGVDYGAHNTLAIGGQAELKFAGSRTTLQSMHQNWPLEFCGSPFNVKIKISGSDLAFHGAGDTSATKNFRSLNSSGTEVFAVADDGSLIGSKITSENISNTVVSRDSYGQSKFGYVYSHAWIQTNAGSLKTGGTLPLKVRGANESTYVPVHAETFKGESVPKYADNTAAKNAGLVNGDFYHSNGALKIAYFDFIFAGDISDKQATLNDAYAATTYPNAAYTVDGTFTVGNKTTNASDVTYGAGFYKVVENEAIELDANGVIIAYHINSGGTV